MTRAKTKAERKRIRRRKPRPGTINLAGGETAQMHAAQGCREKKEPADMTVIEARMRQTGLSADIARSEMAGCAVGRRLLIDHIPDTADLWGAVKHIRSVTVAYDRAIGAPNRHAQCLRIMATPDIMHADASSPAPDIRDAETRARQAVAKWMSMKGWLAHSDARARNACFRAVVDEPDQPIADWTGIVLALRCVSEGIKGQHITTRYRRG